MRLNLCLLMRDLQLGRKAVWTKEKHNIIGGCLKLAVLLTAVLFGGAINSSGAWAQMPQKLESTVCSTLQTSNVVVFVVDQTGNNRTYYGEASPDLAKPAPWFNAKPGVKLLNLQSIAVAVNNPEYCYRWNGIPWCITY